MCPKHYLFPSPPICFKLFFFQKPNAQKYLAFQKSIFWIIYGVMFQRIIICKKIYCTTLGFPEGSGKPKVVQYKTKQKQAG